MSDVSNYLCLQFPPFTITHTLSPEATSAYKLAYNDKYRIGLRNTAPLQLNVQNMRLWFNKQFDDLMGLKRREISLVEERNARFRFIIEGFLIIYYHNTVAYVVGSM